MVSRKTCFIFMTLILAISSQNISNSVNDFAVNLLAVTTSEAGDNLNVALSPFTIWTLLTIISEGAEANSLKQLVNVLKLNNHNLKQIRAEYRNLLSSLTQDADGTHLDFSSAIFTNNKYKLRETFQRTAQQFYDVKVQPIDFKNKAAVQQINKYIESGTKNRIKGLVKEFDIVDAQIFLTSVLYFKGEWKTPFNKTATKTDAFYDEKNNRIGNVEMMYQSHTFPFSRIDEIKAFAVELPYGRDGKMSMIIILPYKGNHVSNTLNLLSRVTFKRVLDLLGDAEEQYVDEDVQVYLPRFKIHSEFFMNRVLIKMGIKDIFNSQDAELLGILDQYLYITKLLQTANIEVDEEGSIASAAAGASFAYKSPPPKFQANHPFLYFIVDKPTQSIIFAGKLSNPSTI
ncbi:serine protease inhibitor 77Ba [Aethina tumida]|uniref:serine protease inhibitor 77Ba n=1 Tax=Aethina tumida TaxID=116153 RepID=UPI00096B17EA|nr:serine protease inhibitor 77Ba [Aethina tumida]